MGSAEDDEAWRARMLADFAKSKEARIAEAQKPKQKQAGLSWGLKVDKTRPAMALAAAPAVGGDSQRAARTFLDSIAAEAAGYSLRCSYRGCNQWFKNKSGLATHEKIHKPEDPSDADSGLALAALAASAADRSAEALDFVEEARIRIAKRKTLEAERAAQEIAAKAARGENRRGAPARHSYTVRQKVEIVEAVIGIKTRSGASVLRLSKLLWISATLIFTNLAFHLG